MITATFDVTDKARDRVLSLRAEQPDSEALALWVEVLGIRGDEFAYDLYFQAAEEADPEDLVLDGDDIAVVVPADSIEFLDGATLTVSRDLLNPGLTMENPNTPPASPTIEAADLNLSGTPEERITTVLEQQINPQIASHGGRAELVAFDNGVVSLRLSGGCQGCGMAAATLRNGIEGTLRGAIPEITEIVDVTDHEAGAQPYY